jgi:hypothetical protein
MSEYLGIKVVKKEGTDNTFEVTTSEGVPFDSIAGYRKVSTEDIILYALVSSYGRLHNDFMKEV